MSGSKKKVKKGVCPKCGYVLKEAELNTLRNVRKPKCPKCLWGYPIVQGVPCGHKYRLVIEGPPCPYDGYTKWKEDC